MPKLADPVELPCGAVLKNRIAKSAMSDVLADGAGGVSDAQLGLYERWAEGGLALGMIGEVQSSPAWPEDPGNLVLDAAADLDRFAELASKGRKTGAALWPQLGNAGALADLAVAERAGPSAVQIGDLECREMTLDEIEALPAQYAAAAGLARKAGFGGVQIHAGHGFLVNQFLSPLFNRRTDAYGGDVSKRARLLLEILEAVRGAVGPDFPIGVKLNSTDLIEGGLEAEDALHVARLLSAAGIDLLEVSGGTYVPGLVPKPRPSRSGPYFAEFAASVREISPVPVMLTGGVKTRADAIALIEDGVCDLVGVARLAVLDPGLANAWTSEPDHSVDPPFPKLVSGQSGDITAWYQRRLRDIAEGSEAETERTAAQARAEIADGHQQNTRSWAARFG